MSSAALQVLQASRERLQLALTPPQADAPQALPPAWLRRLLALGWQRHPWRRWALLAAGAADAVLRPFAQRHPMALVAAGAGVGALLVCSRAWRAWPLAARWLVPLLRAGWLPPSGR